MHIRSPIDMAIEPGGARLYRVRLSPSALPPVRHGDLEDGWAVAREAAAGGIWGEPRLFRFQPAGEPPVDLALTDSDAACWAEAIDDRWGLNSLTGLSLCLRLLSLVDLLGRMPALQGLSSLSRAGARLDPALVRAAAVAPLTMRGSIDEAALERALRHAAPPLLTQSVNFLGVNT